MEHPLMQRWREPEAARLVDEIVRRLLSDDDLGGLGLGEVDGLIDLRGLPVPVATIPVGRWAGTRLVGLDLSHAWLHDASFKEVVFADCRIHHADCEHARWWGCTLTDVSFDRANLYRAILGGDGRPTRHTRVSFRRADLRWSGARNATFESCDFSRARLLKAHLPSALRSCRFEGPLSTLTIEGSPLDGGEPLRAVDFRSADLSKVILKRVDLRLADLPESPDQIVCEPWLEVLEAALRYLGGLASLEATLARIPLEIGLRDAAPGQRVGRIVIKGMAEPELRLLTQALASARRGLDV